MAALAKWWATYDLPYFANSLERRVAAATARVNSDCRPSGPISTSSAAAVVPPGDVTFWRNVAAGSSERCSNSPEPATVSRASYAGPEPDTAVTASIKFSSSIHSTDPVARNSASASAR
jgi:hypothetical protein